MDSIVPFLRICKNVGPFVESSFIGYDFFNIMLREKNYISLYLFSLKIIVFYLKNYHKSFVSHKYYKKHLLHFLFLLQNY